MKFSNFRFVPIFIGLLMLITNFTSCSGDSDEPSGEIPLDAQMDTTYFRSTPSSAVLTISTTGGWSIEKVDTASWYTFSAMEGVGNSTVTINIDANRVAEARFAHLKVSVGSNSRHIYFTQAAATDGGSTTTANFFELPKDTTIANCVKITRNLPGDRSSMRNYTMLYDKKMKLAYWVAYPLTRSYIGGSGRSNAWEYDPLISEGYQPCLYSAFSEWGYARGHQLPSADRTHSRLENTTTFFFSNMTPQNYDLNGGMWVDLESKVRSWMGNPAVDTLYVVTGAMIRTKTNSNVTYAHDNNNQRVAIPKYYFKALAQKRGDSYYTVAFKMNNEEPSSSDSYRNHRLSVADLEAETGFTFFPSLSESVKSQINTSIWTY